MNGLDAYITGGRYSSQPLVATCKACGETSAVLAETEYGATYWTPEECPACHQEWDEDTPSTDDEPDPDRYRDER